MARAYSSHTSSTSRTSHSAMTSGSFRTSNRQVPSQWTEPSSTSKGYPSSSPATWSIRSLVVVDLQPQHHRQALGLHRLDHLDIGVEVHPGVVVPVVDHPRPQGLAGKVVPEPAEQVPGLGEPEQVLGEGDLGDPGLHRPQAVGRHLLDGGLGVGLGVGPEMEVVVEHRPVPPSYPARRMRVTPSRTVVWTTTTRGRPPARR